MKKRDLFFIIPFLMAAGPCQPREEKVTVEEAKLALDEVSLSSQADSLISGSVDITTNFTIGQAVEAAAEELKTFIETQLPCAEIIVNGATLNVSYGVFEGNCVYNGHTYTGSHAVTLTSIQSGNLVTSHTWTDLSNGVVKVSGSATVTWSAQSASRNVQHTLTWTRLSDGKTMTGTGNRTQTTLEGGILEGIQVDGTRKWSGDNGDWEMDIDQVQMRWVDPVPQSGSYTLDTPFDKTLTFTFARLDENTIKVTIASGENSIDLNIARSGNISE